MLDSHFIEDRRRRRFGQLDKLISRGRLLQLSMTCSLVLLLALAACSSKDDGGGSDHPTGPSPGGTGPVSYTAIGASDTTGFGGSSPCLPFSDCPNGTGYVQRITREMGNSGRTVNLLNLGIPGSVVGPEIEDLARQLGRGTIGNFAHA